MTTLPACAAMGAQMRLASPPADMRTISMPAKLLASTARTPRVLPANSTLLPALRSDARGTRLSTGKPRSSRILMISRPTKPVAPRTATLYAFVILRRLVPYLEKEYNLSHPRIFAMRPRRRPRKDVFGIACERQNLEFFAALLVHVTLNETVVTWAAGGKF